MRNMPLEVLENPNSLTAKFEELKKAGLALPIFLGLLTANLNSTNVVAQNWKWKQDITIWLWNEKYWENSPKLDLADHKFNGTVSDTDNNWEKTDTTSEFHCDGPVFWPTERDIHHAFRKTEARKQYRNKIGAQSKRYNFDGVSYNEVSDRSTTFSGKFVLCVDQWFLDTRLDWSLNSSKAATFTTNTISRINTKEVALWAAGVDNIYNASMCEIIVIPNQATNVVSMEYLNDLLYDINGDPLWDKSGLFFTHRFPNVYQTLYRIPNQSLINNVDGIAGMFSDNYTWTGILALTHETTGHIPGNEYANSDSAHNPDSWSYMYWAPTQDVIKTSDVTARDAIDPTSFFNGACGIPLPIELASFIIENEDCKIVKVRRSTESENNNKEFILQISTDGINRKTITTKAWAWDSNKVLNYEYEISMDELKKQSLWQLWIKYFRLWDIDYAGKVHFNSTESLDISECSDQSVYIYPNLIQKNGGTITIKNIPKNNDGQTQLSIIDQSGKIILDKTIDWELNESTMTLANLSAWTYFIRIWVWGLYVDNKIIVQ